MKKLICFLLILILVFVNSGCSKSEHISEIQQISQSHTQKSVLEKKTNDENEIVIGATLASDNSVYLNRVSSYMTETAKEQGVVLKLEYAEWDAKIQTSQMNQFIRDQVDAIIICPINAKSMLPALKKAKAAGIPVINLNMKVDSISTEYIDTYVGASMSEEAAMAAEILVKALGKKGCDVAIIEGAPGSDAQIYRTQTFMEQLTPHPEINIVAMGNGGWDRTKAYLVARDIINKNPELSAIFAHDSNMAMGAIRAIEELKKQKQIIVIGVGEDDEYIKAIQDGKLYGLVTQPPSYEGKYSIYCALMAAQGKELRPWYKDIIKTITKDNVAFYTPETTEPTMPVK